MRNKTCLIIQPGKDGDIICVLPIAKWYADRGFEVYWQCPKQYHELFSYVDYVTPIETANGRYDKTIDLAFGINARSQNHGVWMRKRRMIDSFVSLKYEIAGVPLDRLRTLEYKRNEKAEMDLFDYFGCGDGDPYDVIHSNSEYGSPAEVLSTNKVIEFAPVGSSVFSIGAKS